AFKNGIGNVGTGSIVITAEVSKSGSTKIGTVAEANTWHHHMPDALNGRSRLKYFGTIKGSLQTGIGAKYGVTSNFIIKVIFYRIGNRIIGFSQRSEERRVGKGY